MDFARTGARSKRRHAPRCRGLGAWLAAGVVGLAGAGCASAPGRRAYPSHAIGLDELYARAQASFARAVLYKPEQPSTGLLEPALSPLIVQQVAGKGASAEPLSGIGLVYVAPDGSRHVDASQPTVYVDRRNGFVAGEIRAQTVFSWCQEVALSEDTSTVVCRGLRGTYGSEGFPLVWEVLDPWLEADVIFVSETTESRAEAQYPALAAGRRYHVERALSPQEDAVVAGVLDDGPIPMGPYIYLDARRGEVTTVLCRCMASQVNEFVATTTYRIEPFSQLGPLGKALLSGKGALTMRLRWPDGLP